jgi:hypothetical protein
MNKSECKILSNGQKEWYLDGKHHREDGPAIEYAGGSKSWCINGSFHREDGPAIEWYDGGKSWWYDGKLLDPEKAIDDSELKLKCPKLIESMVAYLVHNS